MRLAGKTAPTPDNLQTLTENGFERTELYLERQHLDEYAAAVAAIDNADVEIVSVHTPHVTADETAYIEQAAQLAERYDALLVFHSSTIQIKEALAIGNQLSYKNVAYENDYGCSKKVIENVILETGHDLVLDTAHLYIASEQFYDDVERLLEHATHLHLCDADKRNDGIPFSEGDIDAERLVQLIKQSSFDRDVVLEVMPEYQQATRERVESVL